MKLSSYNKKRGTFNSQVNVASIISVDTLSMSVYFFIASTSKVESNKMIAMRFKTFTMKVLVFINIYLPYIKIERRHSH